MFRHYLITRFNLRYAKWEDDKNSNIALSEDWLSDRFYLFEKFCFHSIKNQTNRNFEWLVFFDIQTPEKYKKRINFYREVFPEFSPQFVNGMDQFNSSMKSSIKSKCKEKYLITTRLDNDDSLHENFVNEIQKYFNHQEFMVLDLVDGYTLERSNYYKLGKSTSYNNPFVSLIESSVNPETIWGRKHAHLKYEPRIQHIKGKRLWLRIIHRRNKSNWFSGYGKVSSDVLKGFHLPKEELEKIVFGLIPVSGWFAQNTCNYLYTKLKSTFLRLKMNSGYYRLKKRN